MANANVKVAIVHDWLVGGGAERVVYQLHQLYPDAPIYTSYATKEWQDRLDGKVITSYMQHWPLSAMRKFLPVLRVHWFGHLDLSKYDLVLSSSGNGEAFAVRAPDAAIHICYCHSPTHFYWRHYDQYLAEPGFGVFNPLARLGLRLLLGPMQRWDRKAAQRPDYFLANSNHIKDDIKKYYDRDSIVVHPPIDIKRFKVNTGERSGFITVGRQVPMKQTALIVETCTKLALPLTVVGRGPEHDRLVRLAGPTVSFVIDASDTEVARLVANAEAFVFAAYEDFGITPVEAMAAGTPVIAFKAGGALDYVIDGTTGLFFDKQELNSLSRALRDFPNHQFDHQAIAKHAQQFSDERFRQKIKAVVAKTTQGRDA